MKAAQRSIRSAIAATALAALALVFATSTVAQESGKSTSATAREEAQQRQAKLPFAKGTLDSIDLLRHQLKLKTADGLRTFTYTPYTYVFRGKEKITPEGLKTGETIALRFYTDNEGNVLVRRIKAYGTTQPAPAEPPRAIEPAK